VPQPDPPVDSDPLLVNRHAGGDEREDNETVSFSGVGGWSIIGRTSLRDDRLSARDVTKSKRRVAARLLEASGGSWLLSRLPTWRGLIILNYHRIGHPSQSLLDHNLWSATPDDFHAQLAYLKQHFDVIGLSDLEDVLQRRRGRAVMITFDDGYRDNYTEAFPRLKEHGLTATFFVTTGFLDQPQVPWWDEISWMVRTTEVASLPENEWFQTPVSLKQGQETTALNCFLRIYKSLDGCQTVRFLGYLAEALKTGRCPTEMGRELWMTWDMVREMRDQGMSIGGHSVTHPVLASVSAEQQDFEVSDCRRRLMEELGSPVDAFSYPVGGWASFNEITSNALQRHGFRWGFTYLGGYLKPGRYNPYALRRTAVETDIDRSLFRAVLSLPQWFA
jgi:peptidoglycan/xylan/chitin deacetylase (PgdA/CDA1 family)